MSDAGAIGVAVHDVAEILSKKYYDLPDSDKIKPYIGFNLVFLKDLVNIITKEKLVDLYLDEDLMDITFFKNQEKELEYLKEKIGE